MKIEIKDMAIETVTGQCKAEPVSVEEKRMKRKSLFNAVWSKDADRIGGLGASYRY